MQSQKKADEDNAERDDDAPEAAAESAQETATPGGDTETGAEAAPETPEAPEADGAPEAEAEGLEAELAETKDRLLRALAEAENVRRRASRDVDNASKRAVSGFAREMIVVADNLSRALAAVEADAAKDNEALKSLLDGVEMTAREMHNAFERNNIQKVDPLGERFDPQVHEAMFEFEDPSKPSGTVGQVVEVGYALHGQPLRPAKVGVTKGGPKPGPKPAGAAPTPSAQVLDDSDSGAKSSGERPYEDGGEPSGSNLDEEL